MKKLLSLVLAFCVLFSSLLCGFSVNSFAVGRFSGECGPDVTWSLDVDSKTLTVSGFGDMFFYYDNSAPWDGYRNSIEKVIIEEGVTSIANYAFFNTAIKSVYISSTVETVFMYAFSMTKIEEFNIASGSKLSRFELDKNFRNTPWYVSQPNGPVYLGNLLLEYKGTAPENTVVTVEAGTYAINTEAFYEQNGIVDFVFPYSLRRIGHDAFLRTQWYTNQDDGYLYVGKILYEYKLWGQNPQEPLSIREDTVAIADYAFNSRNFTSAVIPASVEYIGQYAFRNNYYLTDLSFEEGSVIEVLDDYSFSGCRVLKNVQLSKSVKRLGMGCFSNCSVLESLFIPEKVEYIGVTAFDSCSIIAFEVSKDSVFFLSDDEGILYNKAKTRLITYPINREGTEFSVPEGVTEIFAGAFIQTKLKKLILPASIRNIGDTAFAGSMLESVEFSYGIENISPCLFYNCDYIKEVVLPKSVRFISEYAFYSCGALESVVVPASVSYISDTAFTNVSDFIIYCYQDSAAQAYASEKGYRYILITDADTSKLKSLLEQCNSLDRNLFTVKSLNNLDSAVETVDIDTVYYTLEQVKIWEESINNALEGLEYLPGDYSAVDSAKEKAQKVQRDFYSQDSLEKLDNAVSAVRDGLDIRFQTEIDQFAYDIENAILSLEYKKADYSAVNSAVEYALSLDEKLYTASSYAILTDVISSIDYSHDIRNQSVADGYVTSVLAAVNALEYCEVVLRNEKHNILVSATSEEIYPTTYLAVDKLDASGLEGANFGVGGSIKSIQYFNIQLILDAQEVQPNGTVSVKIKIPDGVEARRCRVYHVTDDEVDPLVRIVNTLDGEYVVFETDHFSEFAVVEVVPVLSAISVSRLPDKLNYFVGDDIDTTGLQISAIMSDGTSSIVTGYDVSSVSTSSVGKKTVAVYYTLDGITKTTSFDIDVSVNGEEFQILNGDEAQDTIEVKVGFFDFYFKKSITLSYSDIPEGCRVEWSCTGEKVSIDKNGTVSNKGWFFARSGDITAKLIDEEGNVLATDHVKVIFYKLSFQLSRLLGQFISNAFGLED